MSMAPPINLTAWIEEHRHLLKPPVGNQTIYQHTKDFIVMVVGGPNSRKDYHINGTEELFYQVEGSIILKVLEDGTSKDIALSAGELFLLPTNVPHSPRRPAGSVGLVIEKVRAEAEQDSFVWICENCGNTLHTATIPVKDIVADLPNVMNAFFADNQARTCSVCGTVMEKPA